MRTIEYRTALNEALAEEIETPGPRQIRAMIVVAGNLSRKRRRRRD